MVLQQAAKLRRTRLIVITLKALTSEVDIVSGVILYLLLFGQPWGCRRAQRQFSSDDIITGLIYWQLI